MTSKSYLIIALFAVSILLINCKKKESTPEPAAPVTPATVPTVITSAITNITDTTAVSGGTVTAEGASAITAVGVCWDTLPSPTTLKNHTNNGAGVGNYASNITGLKVNKKYYVRAYATNGNGTAYGSEISFLTPAYNLWSKSASASLYSFNCMLSNGASIYAGTTNGVIFSSDTGNTWIAKGLSGSYISNMIQTNNTLYAVTLSADLYRSTDNGTTWTSLSNNFSYPVAIYDIAVLGNKLVAGTDSSAFLSSDAGNSWTRIKNGMPSPVPSWGGGGAYKMSSSGSEVYAFGAVFVFPGSENHLYKYDETNNIWNEKTAYWQQTSITSNVVSGNNLFIATSFSTGTSYIFESTNGGSNFTTASTLAGNNVCVDGNTVFFGNATSDFSISLDNGVTWSPLKKLGLPNSSFGLSFASKYYIWITTSNGIYKYKYN